MSGIARAVRSSTSGQFTRQTSTHWDESRNTAGEFLIYSHLLRCDTANLQSYLLWHTLRLVSQYLWVTVTPTLAASVLPQLILLYPQKITQR